MKDSTAQFFVFKIFIVILELQSCSPISTTPRKIFFFYWLAIRWIISAVCGRYPRVLLAIFDERFQSRFVFTAYLPAVSGFAFHCHCHRSCHSDVYLSRREAVKIHEKLFWLLIRKSDKCHLKCSNNDAERNGDI